MSASIASGRLQDDLAELTGDELEFLRFDWELWARDEQLPPLYMAPSDSPSSRLPEGALFMAPSDCPSSRLPEGALFMAPSDCPSSRLPEGELCVVPGGRFPAGEQPGATNEWRVWMLLGGRGSGKTRAGAEWVRAKACDPYFGHEARIALVGKTLGDVRSVMIEGVSGLLAIHPERERPLFESSKRQLTWPNGAIAQMFGADEADQLRGPQFTHAWCDELAKGYRAENAWDMLQFALRLGEAPQAVVTTTPKPLRLLRKIMEDSATVSVKLATADNVDNLVLEHLRALRGGQDRIESGLREIGARLTSLEASTAAGRRDSAHNYEEIIRQQ